MYMHLYVLDVSKHAYKPGKEVVEWAAGGGKNDPAAEGWFRNMPSISGVKFNQANVADFQRLYYCAPPGILDLLMSLAVFSRHEPHYDWGIVFRKIWLIFSGSGGCLDRKSKAKTSFAVCHPAPGAARSLATIASQGIRSMPR